MRALFLTGVLWGVIIAAAVTFVFAIPGNSDYWRMEIWKRGDAVWCFDKNGHFNWAWTVKPIPETCPAKRIIEPSSDVRIQSERLYISRSIVNDGGKSPTRFSKQDALNFN